MTIHKVMHGAPLPDREVDVGMGNNRAWKRGRFPFFGTTPLDSPGRNHTEDTGEHRFPNRALGLMDQLARYRGQNNAPSITQLEI